MRKSCAKRDCYRLGDHLLKKAKLAEALSSWTGSQVVGDCPGESFLRTFDVCVVDNRGLAIGT